MRGVRKSNSQIRGAFTSLVRQWWDRRKPEYMSCWCQRSVNVCLAERKGDCDQSSTRIRRLVSTGIVAWNDGRWTLNAVIEEKQK